MKNYKQLKIWQNGMQIAFRSYKLVETFPKEEKYALSGQITSAAVSIPSNIAEGNSRTSDKDKGRFIQIALGSSFELQTQLLIAESLDFGNKAQRKELLEKIEEETMMLHGFLATLKT